MLEVGRIDRPHGVRGEVLVSLTSNRVERVAPGAVLHTPTAALAVVSSRPHKNRHIVVFEGIGTREAAEGLQGSVLSAEPIDDPDELWVHEMVGATVIDQHDVERGVVVRLLENPASDLLELDRGSLVPVRFVESVDPGVEIRVDVPEGLFDLDDT